MFSEEFGEHLRSNFDLEAALHSAVDRNELVLHYQPIVDARTGRVTGAEALMRWMRGGQLITPASFIPLAEENGLVFRMGEWAISEALQQVRRWQLRGLGLTSVSVNINVRHLVQPSLTRAVTQALEATQLPPSTLTLELTESDVMQDIEKALSALAHAQGPWRAARARRFRYRLLVARLPDAAAARLPEDRPLVHPGDADQSAAADGGARHRRAGLGAGPHHHRRRRRESRGTGRACRRWAARWSRATTSPARSPPPTSIPGGGSRS